MLIRNYGLFWQRDNVEWGWKGKGNQGRLLGRLAVRKKSPSIDFRDQRGVYVLYDDNFRIIYVGQAGGASSQRLFARLKQHKYDHLAQRWSRFSWFGILAVDGEGLCEEEMSAKKQEVSSVLNHIEAILLAASEPPLNLQRGRFGSDVQQYIQYIEEYEEDSED